VDLYRAGGLWQEEPLGVGDSQMIRGSLCFLLAREPGAASWAWARDFRRASDGYIRRGRPGIPRTRHRPRDHPALTDRCVAAGLTWIGLVAEPGTQKFYRPGIPAPHWLSTHALTRCAPDCDGFSGFPFAPSRSSSARSWTIFWPATRNPCLTTVRLRCASGRRFSITTTPSPSRIRS